MHHPYCCEVHVKSKSTMTFHLLFYSFYPVNLYKRISTALFYLSIIRCFSTNFNLKAFNKVKCSNSKSKWISIYKLFENSNVVASAFDEKNCIQLLSDWDIYSTQKRGIQNIIKRILKRLLQKILKCLKTKATCRLL